MATEGSIRSLMRPSDQVKVILEAFVPPGPNDPPNAPVPSTDSADDLRRRRIVAVVAHSDGSDTQEEGSVFVLKAKAASSGGTFTQSDILRVFPVFGEFSISMAQVQVRRATLDLRRSASQTSAGLGLISLTIKQGDIPGLEPLTLHTQDVQTLRDVLAECKRLKEIADAPPVSAAPPLTTFSWLAPYTSQRAPLPDLFSIPPDLRTTRKPLHTRLSAAFAGSESGDDLTDVIRIRDDWIARSVREECVSGRYPLRIRIGSFNVNGNLPSQDLSSWLGSSADFGSLIPPLKEVSPFNVDVDGVEKESDPFEGSEGAKASEVKPPALDAGPDIYVLGFQELDLSTEALIYSTTTVKEDAWCTAVFAALGERAEGYEKLVSKQLVGILIVVIVRKTLRRCFSDIKTAAAGTGIMGLMGNKGGTAVRIKFTPPSPAAASASSSSSPADASQLKPTVLTFVNSHLAAFDDMYEKRNADFGELVRRLVFDSGTTGGAGVSVPCNVFESDVVFWMGDLNYRIDAPDVDVRTVLGEKEQWSEGDRGGGRFEVLLRYDQLKAAMRTKKAFDMFEEGKIEHFPTYRFNAGLLKDDLGYDLKRRPAWTDRILYTSNASAPTTQLSYTGHPQITMSDHRPVSAEFNVEVDIMNLLAAERAADKLYRQLKGLEDAHEDTNARVNLKILNSAVDMGRISYGRGASQKVEVRNIGKVPCAYRLVPVDSEEAIHPDWLTVEPMTALLLPDEAVQVTLTASIDVATAARLNIDHKVLDCTLILHTVMGKDHFIAVSAEYQPTCFANSLERLTRLPGPIRSLSASSELLAEDRAINAPREVMRLVNWMMAPEIKFDNVFISPADPETVDIIREYLDTGAEFPFSASANPEDDKVPIAFGETLFQLLDSLTEPLVPYELHARCAEMTSRDEAFEMLDALPAANVNVWISVTAFLHFVCSTSSDPELRARKIANKFASALLRDPPPNATTNSGNAVSPIGRRNFLLYFIE